MERLTDDHIWAGGHQRYTTTRTVRAREYTVRTFGLSICPSFSFVSQIGLNGYDYETQNHTHFSLILNKL